MKTIEKDALLEFILSNHRFWATRSREVLATYLAWFQDRGLLASSFVGEEPFAICAVRFFDRLEDFLDQWAFNPEGDFCMIELLVSASPLAQADTFNQLVGRWGPRKVVIWERGDRTIESAGSPRMFTWEGFVRLTRRMTYGTIDL